MKLIKFLKFAFLMILFMKMSWASEHRFNKFVSLNDFQHRPHIHFQLTTFADEVGKIYVVDKKTTVSHGTGYLIGSNKVRSALHVLDSWLMRPDLKAYIKFKDMTIELDRSLITSDEGPQDHIEIQLPILYKSTIDDKASELKQGDQLITMGYPFGSTELAVVSSYVLKNGKTSQRLMTTGPGLPGMSGGPIFKINKESNSLEYVGHLIEVAFEKNKNERMSDYRIAHELNKIMGENFLIPHVHQQLSSMGQEQLSSYIEQRYRQKENILSAKKTNWDHQYLKQYWRYEKLLKNVSLKLTTKTRQMTKQELLNVMLESTKQLPMIDIGLLDEYMIGQFELDYNNENDLSLIQSGINSKLREFRGQTLTKSSYLKNLLNYQFMINQFDQLSYDKKHLTQAEFLNKYFLRVPTIVQLPPQKAA